jgi:alpha-galactosidase
MLYPFPRIYLRGLKPDSMYRIAALDGRFSADTPVTASGSFWMQHGVEVELRGDFQAAALTLEKATR